MKILQVIVFIAAGMFLMAVADRLFFIPVASRQPIPQISGMTENKGVLGQYEQLVLSLYQRGDTNTANEVASLATSVIRGRDATDIGITLAVLRSLRSGDTNRVISLLETHLDGMLVQFSWPSTGPRDPQYDKILERVKEYRAQYPHTSGNPEVDNMVNRILDLPPARVSDYQK